MVNGQSPQGANPAAEIAPNMMAAKRGALFISRVNMFMPMHCQWTGEIAISLLAVRRTDAKLV